MKQYVNNIKRWVKARYYLVLSKIHKNRFKRAHYRILMRNVLSELN